MSRLSDQVLAIRPVYCRLLVAVRIALQKRFPESGFEVRSRANAAPQFQRNIERFTQFLTLVGLTALMVGGVGVANAVPPMSTAAAPRGDAEERWARRAVGSSPLR